MRSRVGWSNIGRLSHLRFAIGLLAASTTPLASGAQPRRTQTYRPLERGEATPPAKVTTVRGIVTDSEKLPITGAIVRAKRLTADSTPAEERSAESDAAGRFEFADLTAGTWAFGAEHEDFAPAWCGASLATVPTPDRETSVHLKLWPPVDFTARVVDASGDGVPDVNVGLIRERLPDGSFPQPNSSTTLRETRTDSEGRFTFHGVNPGTAGLLLEKAGFATTYPMAVDVSKSDNVLTLDPGLTLRGQVVQDGEPVAGTVVHIRTISFSHRNMGSWDVQTDRDGRFEISGVADLSRYEGISDNRVATVFVGDDATAARLYEVYKNDDGTLDPFTVDPARLTAGVDQQRVNVGQRQERDPFTFTKVERGTASIRVRGRYRPEETVLRLLRIDTADQTPGREFPPTNDEEGVRFVDLPAGRYRVLPQWQTISPFLVPADVAVADGQPVEIALKSGPASIEGGVSCGGSPLPGVMLSLRDQRIDSFLQFSIPSDAGGRIRAEGLEAGHYVCRVDHLESSLGHESRIELRPGKNTLDIDLPQGEFQLTINDDRMERNPVVPLRFFWLRRLGEERSEHFSRAAWPEAGPYVIRHIPPGTYAISTQISSEPPLWAFGSAKMPRGGGRVAADLRPAERPGAIAGSVAVEADTASARSKGIRVVCARASDLRHGVTGIFPAEVQEDGRFRIGGLPAGDYTLSLGGPQSPRFPPVWLSDIRVRPAFEVRVDITVPAGVPVELRVNRHELATHADVDVQMPGGPTISLGQLRGMEEWMPLHRAIQMNLAPGVYRFHWRISNATGVEQLEVIAGAGPLAAVLGPR